MICITLLIKKLIKFMRLAFVLSRLFITLFFLYHLLFFERLQSLKELLSQKFIKIASQILQLLTEVKRCFLVAPHGVIFLSQVPVLFKQKMIKFSKVKEVTHKLKWIYPEFRFFFPEVLFIIRNFQMFTSFLLSSFLPFFCLQLLKSCTLKPFACTKVMLLMLLFYIT